MTLWLVCLILPVNPGLTQDQQARIDSLVNLLKTAGREWNQYAEPLISIGEPAVPALIKVAQDRSLSQWNRRVSIMTLNDIHSVHWVKPALNILLDRNEDPGLRNQVTAGLKGFDLSGVKEDLWELYKEGSNGFYKSNIAHLLLTADTSMAYRSFHELYYNSDGYVQKTAMLNLVSIRPQESTCWYLDGIQVDDWMTANTAMDSLVATPYFVAGDLVSLYHESGISEEIQWRIVFVLGHRRETGSLSLLLEAFQDEKWLVHTEAAVGLCNFDPGDVLPEMKSLRNDPRPYIRSNSRWVIRRIKTTKSAQLP